MTIANKLRNKGLKEGRKEGLMEGIEKGQKRKAVKSALKMLKADLSVAEIIEFTELSETEISLLKAYFEKFDMEAIEHIIITDKGIDVK